MKKSKRKFVVLSSFIAFLTALSALLLALAPPPLAADGPTALSASDRGFFLNDIFKTQIAARGDQWKYIFIHHSATSSGNATTLALPQTGLCDHFVVGNGAGCQDGEIQVGRRWNLQQPAAPAPGLDHIEASCVSICVVGDFDHSMPTPTQLHRLVQLVSTLQSQLRIGNDKVIMLSDSGTPSSAGRYFPVTAFRDQILP